MRPLIRRLLVALIRKTPPPRVLSDAERWERCVADADSLTERVWESMRGNVVWS